MACRRRSASSLPRRFGSTRAGHAQCPLRDLPRRLRRRRAPARLLQSRLLGHDQPAARCRASSCRERVETVERQARSGWRNSPPPISTRGKSPMWKSRSSCRRLAAARPRSSRKSPPGSRSRSTCRRPGLVVLADLWDAGWHAYYDGKPSRSCRPITPCAAWWRRREREPSSSATSRPASPGACGSAGWPCWLWWVGPPSPPGIRAPPSSLLKKGTGSEPTGETPRKTVVVRCLSPFFNRLLAFEGKKGTGPIRRNGPEGASHKLDLSPSSPHDVKTRKPRGGMRVGRIRCGIRPADCLPRKIPR